MSRRTSLPTGSRRLLLWGLPISTVLLLPRCDFEPIELEGRPCPCAAQFRCDPSTGRCTREPATPDAGGDGGIADSGPVDGSDGGQCTVIPRDRTLASGRAHVCALSQGRLFCFGENALGQLGDGTQEPRIAPVEPQFPGAFGVFMHLSSTVEFTCARNTGQEAWCWGASPLGQAGKVADVVTPPNRVALNVNYLDLSAGEGMTVALNDAKRLIGWGTRTDGALGDNKPTAGPTAVPVLASSQAEFVRVEAGSGHACALGVDATTQCWGRNDCRQWQAEDQASIPTEALVGCLTDLALGAEHTCYIDADRRLFCRGSNRHGALGVGDAPGQTLLAPDGGVVCEDVFDAPMQVLPSKRFTRVFASTHATCAISDDGEAFCFGDNQYGSLGVGPARLATPTQVLPALDWAEFAVGVQQTCARPTGSDDLYCMGESPAVSSPGLMKQVVLPD